MKHQAVLALAASSLAIDWDAAHQKASAALRSLSLPEKVAIVTGVGWQNGPCVGNTSPAPAIRFPPLCLHDGPLGTRFASAATAFPPAIHAAATWDTALIRARGAFMAREARQLGVHVLLGPCVGPLGKIPHGGRGWEAWGPDPYLAGVAAAETVAAMQHQGVQATVKHWLLNEQEHQRTSISADADARTVRELYAWPFADALRAGAVSVMCSYNRINGTFACESKEALADLLKREMGFRGYVMTDWNAQHSTAQSAAAGLDMAMPGDDYSGGHIWWGPQLEDAVRRGDVDAARVDDMVARVLAGWYLTGQDRADFPTVDLRRAVQADAHTQNARDVARDGIVLLKNEGGTLPLHSGNGKGQGKGNITSIAVIGSGAVAGRHARNQCPDMGCNHGALGMGWGSGSVPYPYFVAPYDAILARAAAHNTPVALSGSDDPAAAAGAARAADLALVFITADAGEGYISVEGSAGDRTHLDPWHNGNELVRAAAEASDNVVVVVHSVGPVVLEGILAHQGVKALVWAGLPSQESGNALVDVLWGDVSPSGKLVYTIARREGDYGTEVRRGRDAFDEGLLVDYRGFDARGISPRYEFGFGLWPAYTEFTYSALRIRSSATPGRASGPIEPGGPADLFDVVATVTIRIQNTGRVAGAEVAQLYITLPESVEGKVPQQLRGFAKLHLQSGEAGTARFELRRRDLSYWAGEWVLPEGEFGVMVGASSRDVRARGSLYVPGRRMGGYVEL